MPKNQKRNPIPKPKEFFDEVIKLNSVLEVNQRVNELLDLMSERWQISTISKSLTPYKDLFYEFIHENPELNEVIEIKGGQKTQHIAGNLLRLNEEQNKILYEARKRKELKSAGFDETGEIRNVEIPQVDICKIIQKSVDCLSSNNPYVVASGLINLTGLRSNEQNLPKIEDAELGMITRNLVSIGDYKIAFKGLSKERTIVDKESYHVRFTLAPAEIIEDAQNKYLKSKEVQQLSGNYKEYNQNFYKSFSKKYKELFGEDLSTIEVYDDDGCLTDINGTPHKGRAFYACALRSILKNLGIMDATINKYIQVCLNHSSLDVTQKYLSKYDQSQFINPPNIKLPSNIYELNKLTKLPEVKQMNTTTKTTSNKATFDIEQYIAGLDSESQLLFTKLLNDNVSITNAVLAVHNSVLKNKPDNSQNVKDEISVIVDAVIEFNNSKPIMTDKVIPTYTLVDKVSQRLRNKQIAKITFDKWKTSNKSILDSIYSEFDLSLMKKTNTEEPSIERWNGAYHRKTMNNVIDEIVTILNRE